MALIRLKGDTGTGQRRQRHLSMMSARNIDTVSITPNEGHPWAGCAVAPSAAGGVAACGRPVRPAGSGVGGAFGQGSAPAARPAAHLPFLTFVALNEQDIEDIPARARTHNTCDSIGFTRCVTKRHASRLMYSAKAQSFEKHTDRVLVNAAYTAACAAVWCDHCYESATTSSRTCGSR